MVAMFTRSFASHGRHGGEVSGELMPQLGKFEFLNTEQCVYMYLLSDIVYRTNFRATFRYAANSFS